MDGWEPSVRKAPSQMDGGAFAGALVVDTIQIGIMEGMTDADGRLV